MSQSLTILAEQMRDIKRQVVETHAHLASRCMRDLLGKCGTDGREDRAHPPGLRIAIVIHACLHPYSGDRVKVIVADVILARPEHLNRPASLLGEDGCFSHIIGLGLPTKSTPEQGDTNDHLLGRDPEGGSHRTLSRLRVLGRRPDEALAITVVRGSHRRFHRLMKQVRHVVAGLMLFQTLDGLGIIPFLTDHLPALAGRLQQS